jgi:MFS family permease
MRLGRSAAVLRERGFRRLFLARASSLLGDGLVGVALAFAVLEVDGSPAALGIVLAARTVPFAALLLVGGVVADRLPRQRLMVAADLLRAFAQGLTAILLIAGTAELWELAALSALAGVGQAFFIPASTGLITQTVPRGQLQEANALLALTQSTLAVGGPVIAGILVATTGPGEALAVDAATFLVSAWFLAGLSLDLPPSSRPAAAFLHDLRDGWREFRSRTWLWVDGLFSALGNMLVGAPTQVLGPVIAARELGGAAAWATIAAGMGAGAVLGGLAALQLRPARPLVTGVSALIFFGLPAALLAIPAPTLVIAAGAVLSFAGLALFNTLFETTLQREVPAEALSRVASIDWMLSLGLAPIGYALVGPVSDTLGEQETLAAASIYAVVSTLVVLAVPSVRAVRRPEDEAPATTP